RIKLSNTVPVHLKLFSTNCTANLNGDNHQQGMFPNRKNNDITVLESQKQKPTRTDAQWSPTGIHSHSSVRPSIYTSYMIRPTSAEEQHLINPSSSHPMHVSYDYDLASAGGPLLSAEQNGQSPPLFELLPRHSYGRDQTNKVESILDDKKSDSGETSDITNTQQLQTSSIISPILNGASRMFWKFWNNINQQSPPTILTSTNHSSYGIPQSHHSHRMAL
ncbi:hypothetical protein BLA29_011217, partial [Euroglyphus maynei]